MKIKMFTVVLGVLVILPCAAQADNMEIRQSIHYRVFYDGRAESADELAREMDQRFEAYNRIFRFDPQTLTTPLKIRLFNDPENYFSYIQTKLGKTKDGAVYLHYQKADLRELVICRSIGNIENLIAHQSFIQFLRAFVPNPPAWIRDGFATYFTTYIYSKERKVIEYEENLAWLDTVKTWNVGAALLNGVILADVRGAPENFIPASWSLVSFFLNSENDEYRRTLWEAIMLLDPELSAAENSALINKRFAAWLGQASFPEDFKAYIESRKSFMQLLDLGRRAYEGKEFSTAELHFLDALELKPTHFAPYYYLGLLAYEDRQHELAEHYFNEAMKYGAEEALLRYALGLNALAQGRTEEARTQLKMAASLAPDRYRAKAEELMSR